MENHGIGIVFGKKEKLNITIPFQYFFFHLRNYTKKKIKKNIYIYKKEKR